jgi:putative methylase
MNSVRLGAAMARRRTDPPRALTRAELVQALSRLEAYGAPRAEAEQVPSPPEAAATLLFEAVRRDDLVGRSVVDLGCGTGVLAVGAALLGAERVEGTDSDREAVAVARRNATDLSVGCILLEGRVEEYSADCDTVVMNPPFGAQRRHADRPFWEAAFRVARRRIYAFASDASRTFIADSAVARGARVEAIEPVPWRFPRTFPHHRKRSVELSVDLWVLTPRTPNDDGTPRA